MWLGRVPLYASELYCYATTTVSIIDVVRINDRSIINIVRTDFEKIAILFFGAHLKRPRFFGLECSYPPRSVRIHPEPTYDRYTLKLNSVALVRKELYRTSDRRLSMKLVSTFADRGCCVLSARDPYGC
jgi:hypothetical protein